MWRGLLCVMGGCDALSNMGFSHFRAHSALNEVDCFALSVTKLGQDLPHC